MVCRKNETIPVVRRRNWGCVEKKAQVGHITTHSENGYPYVVPVHFIIHNDKIYIHGLIKGQKISNLTSNNKVCFEVDEMEAIIPDDKKSVRCQYFI